MSTWSVVRPGWSTRGSGGTIAKTTASASEIEPDELDAVIIPGGYSPDHTRRCVAMVDLVRAMGESGEKPVAAVCHGPWMLASASLLAGRRATAFFSIGGEVVKAGAEWVDEEVVRDANVITSLRPDDLPAFMRQVMDALQREPAHLG